jgi:hypothetical protein
MSSNLVVLATFETIPEAHIARNALIEAGIPAELSDENTGGLWWTVANALSGIKLSVLESDYQRAIAIVGPLVGMDDASQTPIRDEELTRQALAETGEEAEEGESPDEPPTTPTASTPEPPARDAPQPIDREKAARLAFVFGWVGIAIFPLAFLAMDRLLNAALNSGQPRTRLGRVRLFVAT